MNDFQNTDIQIILNVFYPPVEKLKNFIEENEISSDGIYFPINGCSNLEDEWSQKHLAKDNIGNNISEKNPLLNEMTSIYWYWKNIHNKPNYVGFNHYRRFFKLEDIKDFKNYDIIVSKPIWSSNEISLAYQYKYYHVLNDLQICIDTIRESDYEWGENFRKYLLNTGINYAPCNMFVMKREFFEEWCEFIFPLLEKLSEKICKTEEFLKRDNYQKRALCFLTERIFNYWYFLKKTSGFKTKEIDIEEYLDFKPEGKNERGDFSIIKKQKKKYSILTFNFNDYELMREPFELDDECEYIYVTDNPDYKTKTKKWNVVLFDENKTMSVFERCYRVRYNLFDFVSTNLCICIDGSIQIKKSLKKIIDDFITSDADVGINVHPERTKLMEEYFAWIKFRGYLPEQAKRNLQYFSLNGYDLNYNGLYQATMRICKNTSLNKLIDTKVLDTLIKLGISGRIERLDQVVYSFILNRYFNNITVFPFSQQVFQSDYLAWYLHNSTTEIPYNKGNNNDSYVFNQLVKLYHI